MLGTLLTWALGGGLSSLEAAIADAYRAKLAAANDSDRIAAEVRIATLEAQRDVLLADSANGGLSSWIRPSFALIFLAYNAKLIIWDTMLGLGSTPPLSDHLYAIEGLVIGSYFISRGIEKVARIVKA